MAKGDHIFAQRWWGVYTHHGIDMGDGTVVHFSGEPLHQIDAAVRRVTMDEFLKGRRACVVAYAEDIEVLTPDETVRRAQEQIGRVNYCLFRNNCEHFATYCKTGEPYSVQVDKFIRVAGIMVLAGIATAGAYIGARISRRGPRA